MGGPKPQIDFDAESFGPDLSGSYRVAGIEVTQAIQDMNHSVTLIAGKATMIRVYLDRPEVTAVTVRGEIEIAGTGGSAAVPSLDTLDLNDALNGNVDARRADLATSLNFVLPQEMNVAGRWTVRVARIVTTDMGTELTDAAPGVSRTYEMIDAPPLRVRVVSIRHKGGNPVKTYEPRAIDHELVASWLRRAFPVPAVEITRVTTDALRPWPFTATNINAQITAMRSLDLASGGDPLAHYVAIVFDGGGRTFMRGKASVIPNAADPSAVASAPVGAAAYPWDTDGSYGDWYTAHELAHTFGRRHLGTVCGDAPPDGQYPFSHGTISGPDQAFVGFDFGDPALGVPMKIYRGTTSHDLMCYCDFIWMSAYTYEAIRERIGDEASIAAGPGIDEAVEAMMMTMEPAAWLNVIGTVDLTDRTGTIDFVQPHTAVDVPQDETPPVTIALFDAQNTLLQVVPARVKRDTCRDEDEHEEGVVDTFVPHLDGLARLELRIDGAPVASYSAPVESGTESLAALNSLSEAAPSVRYNVQVSPDDGRTWQTVAVGIEDPAGYAIKRSDFPRAASLKRRLTATDGFRTWSVSEETIENGER